MLRRRFSLLFARHSFNYSLFGSRNHSAFQTNRAKQTLHLQNYAVNFSEFSFGKAFLSQEAKATISKEELADLINKKKDYVLVDVREAHEHEHGIIPTAKSIPLNEIPSALAPAGLSHEEFQDTYGFPKPKVDERIIFYCRSGARSGVATHLARSLGYTKAINYAGSFIDWFGFSYP